MANRIYRCDCAAFCQGTSQVVSKSTFYEHRRPHTSNTSTSTPTTHGTANQDVDPGSPNRMDVDDVNMRDDVLGNHSEAHGNEALFGDDAPDPGSIADETRRRRLAVDEHAGQDDVAGPDSDNDPVPPNQRIPERVINNDFEPLIPELGTSLQFKRALENASLDNGDLTTEQLLQLRNPPQYKPSLGDRAERLSIRLFLSTTNSSNRTYTDVRADVMAEHPEDNLLSHDGVKKVVAKLTGVSPMVHDMCPNSCVAYTGPFSALDKCPNIKCGEPRYHPQTPHAPRQQFYTNPLGPQLQALWRSPESAANMEYRHTCTSEILEELQRNGGIIHEYNDIYHGRDYLTAVHDKRIAKGDMVLIYSMDGAQLYLDKQSDCWIYIWVIVDLPPHLRYKKRFVLPGGFIPGPNNPWHTVSFMHPGFYHLAALQKEGLKIWNAGAVGEAALFTSFPFLLLGTADGPGSVHFTGLVGHHGAYPCRLYCDLKGCHKPGKPHYLPALLKPDDYTVAGCDHPDVSVNDIHPGSAEEYDQNLWYLLNSRGPTDYKNRRRDTGIADISLFSGLPPNRRLPIPTGFPGDFMHMPTLNLGELLIPLWRGTLPCFTPDTLAEWDWAVLIGETWIEHGAMVGRARAYMPGSFDNPPRNIAEKVSSGFKAKEWQSYLYGLGSGLLYGILPRKYFRNFCKLVYAIRILLQRIITAIQLHDAFRRIQEFVVEFEELYYQRRAERLHIIRPCIHALLHAVPETSRIGPQTLSSAWTMERTIGNLGEEVKQPSNPYANLSERGLRRAQVNALKAMFPELDRDHDMQEKLLPRGSLVLGDGYALLRAKDEHGILIEGEAGVLIKNYILQAEAELGNIPPEDWAGSRISRWARLLLLNGQIARSLWKEDLKPLYKLRQARCVKLSIKERIEFGDIHYYFNVTIGGKDRHLALVSVHSRPDTWLFEESYSTVWSVTKGSQGLQLVDVKSILSVISLQPHNYTLIAGEQRYFVWEDMGLEMSLLSGILQGHDIPDE